MPRRVTVQYNLYITQNKQAVKRNQWAYPQPEAELFAKQNGRDKGKQTKTNTIAFVLACLPWRPRADSNRWPFA